MKAVHLTNLLTKQIYWWLGITIALSIIYVGLVWQAKDTAHLGMSLLFGAAVGSLLWDKRDRLCFESQARSWICGSLLLGLILWQSMILPNQPILPNSFAFIFLRLFPWLAFTSISILFFGFKELKQYQQELLILFFLGAPSVLASFLIDISPITAKFSAFLLWYTGFDVSIQDVYVKLPTGSVKVYAGCSGIESMTYLLGLSVLSLVLMPISRLKQFFVPVVAIAIGFTVNGLRVALLAALAAPQNKALFDYWHIGTGSLIFGAIAIAIFWGVYFLLVKLEEAE